MIDNERSKDTDVPYHGYIYCFINVSRTCKFHFVSSNTFANNFIYLHWIEQNAIFFPLCIASLRNDTTIENLGSGNGENF